MLVAVVFAAAFLVVFHEFLFDFGGVRLLGFDDMWQYHGPNQFFLDSCLRAGVVPLWNPLVLCGVPFAANPQTMLWYPPNLIRALCSAWFVAWPTPLSTHISLALLVGFHFVLLATGTYLLARDYGLGRVPALLAATVATLGGRNTGEPFLHPNFLFLTAWMPITLLLMHRSLVTPKPGLRMAYAGVAGLAWGMQFLVGFPQLLIYASIGYAVYYTLHVILPCRTAESQCQSREALIHAALGALTPGIIMCLVAVGISAIVLLPAAELTPLSLRGADDGRPSLLREGIMELPTSSFVRIAWNSSHGDWAVVLPVIYLLLELPLRWTFWVLVLAALLRRTSKELLLFAGLAYALLDCAVGPPLPLAWLASHAAPFRLGSSVYGFHLLACPLSILVGMGLEAVLAPSRAMSRALLPALVGGALLASVHLVGAGLPADTRLSYMLASVVLAFVVLPGIRPKPRAALILLTVLIELVLWQTQFVAIELRGTFRGFYPGPEAVLRQSNVLPTVNSRGLCPVGNTTVYGLEPVVNGYEPTLMTEVAWVLESGGGLNYHGAIALKTISDNPRVPLLLKRRFWLVREYVKGPLPAETRLFAPTTVAFLQEEPGPSVPTMLPEQVALHGVSSEVLATHLYPEAEAPLSGAPERWEKDGLTHWTFKIGPATFPALHSVLSIKYEAAARTTTEIKVEDLDTGKVMMLGPVWVGASQGQDAGRLEWPLPDVTHARLVIHASQTSGEAQFRLMDVVALHDRADENARVTIVSAGPNRVEAEVRDLPSPRLLVFVEAAYPGWSATIDGQSARLLRADDAFQAVVVPPGSHRISFAFRPWRVYCGAGISLGTLLGAAGVVLAGFRKSVRCAQGRQGVAPHDAFAAKRS